MPLWTKTQAKVFISVDVIGSTSMKTVGSKYQTSKVDLRTCWYQQTLKFYYGFNNRFLSELTSLQKKLKSANAEALMTSLPKPKVWKVIGDEMLYECAINNEYEIYHLLTCFSRAVQKYNNRNLDLDQTYKPTHKVKGTAWLSTFPVINKTIYIRSDFGEMLHDMAATAQYWMHDQVDLSKEYKKHGNIKIDYIGQSIDIGFRIKKHSTTRKLVLSSDLALVLSSAKYDMTNEFRFNPEDIGDLYYEGLVNIYGLSSATDYPLFWIDTAGSQMENSTFCYESMLDIVENKHSLKPEIILSFLQSYFISKVKDIHHPYIPGSRKYGSPTDGYNKLEEVQLARHKLAMERSKEKKQSFDLANDTNTEEIEDIVQPPPTKETIINTNEMVAEVLKKIKDSRASYNLGKKTKIKKAG